MLIIPPGQRLTVEQVLASPWVQGQKIAGGLGSGAVYRGGVNGFTDPEQLRAMLASESDQAMAPVYRGGAPAGPPPMLRKQDAMFCADFHLEDNEPL